MEVLRHYIEIMTDTASNDMRWLSERDARSMLEVQLPSGYLQLAASSWTGPKSKH